MTRLESQMMSKEIVTDIVIDSRLYGELRPEQHQIYEFHQGIVGFSHLNRFALLPYEDTQLFILQSFQDDISLLLLPAAMCRNSDGFHVDEATIAGFEVQNSDGIIAFYILRFIEEQAYINLKAPILIEPTSQKGCQYVLNDDTVSVRERLILAGEADART